MGKQKQPRVRRERHSKQTQAVAPNQKAGQPSVVRPRSKWRLPVLVISLVVSASLGLFWGLPTYWETQAAKAMLSGRLSIAESYFEKLEAWQPRNDAAALGLARVSRRVGNPTRARALIKIAESRGAPVAETELERILLKIQSGAAAAMVDRLPSLLIESPDFGPDIFDAYVNGFAALGLHERSLGFVDQWLEAAPMDANAHYRKAEVMESLERPSEAEKYYESALRLDPSLLTAKRGLAQLKLALDKTDEALSLFEAVAAADPHDTYSRLLQCKALRDVGREDEAVVCLQAILAIDEKSYAARHLLANIYQKRGKSAAVIECVLPLLKTFPDDVSIHYLLATAYSETGETVLANRHLQKHLDGRKRLDELSELAAVVEARQQRVKVPLEDYLQLCNGYLQYQWDEAEPWLAKVLDEYPDAVPVYLAMSELQRKLGNSRKAAEFSRAAEEKTR